MMVRQARSIRLGGGILRDGRVNPGLKSGHPMTDALTG
jgi:hypothetical protein